MNPAAAGAAHGPVFGGAARDDAEHGELGLAFRAVIQEPRRGRKCWGRLGLAPRRGGDYGAADYREVSDGSVEVIP
jgi:hypothetical protein